MAEDVLHVNACEGRGGSWDRGLRNPATHTTWSQFMQAACSDACSLFNTLELRMYQREGTIGCVCMECTHIQGTCKWLVCMGSS